MSKNEEKGCLSFFGSIIIWSLGICVMIVAIVWGIDNIWQHTEKERIANMTSTEYIAYSESLTAEEVLLDQEKQQQAEAAAREAEAVSVFESEMRSYESEAVQYVSGEKGNSATFQLTDIASGKRPYVFGTDLPAGQRAFLEMSGRGWVGIGRSGNPAADWSRAGRYGRQHFETYGMYDVQSGDFLQFEGLTSVSVRISF